MEPNSLLLFVTLALTAVGLLVLVATLRRVLLRVAAGVLALAVAMVTGMAAVNDYYGYYQTWSQLSADFSRNYAAFTGATTVSRVTGGSTATGRLVATTLPGPLSGITQSAYVYLPAQYFDKRFAHTDFPVVELVHGTPGSPSDWVVHLNVVRAADQLIAKHLMGPMILLMPTMAAEGLNTSGVQYDTYLTSDVRTAITTHFRASADPSQWAIAGFSSGGYAAANLALRHRSDFGAAGIMDGYFRPQDGPAASLLNYQPAALASNDPLATASRLPSGVSPLPAFWLAAGTGNTQDYQGAQAFVGALHGLEQVPFLQETGAGHNFYAWADALPRMLAWTWQQIAPTQLRVDFPVAGPVDKSVVIMPTWASHLRSRRAHHSHLTVLAGGGHMTPWRPKASG